MIDLLDVNIHMTNKVVLALKRKKAKASPSNAKKTNNTRPVTRILCGGGANEAKVTKLPKCIFYCLIRLFRKEAIHEKL